jgi:hypothetical protein
MERVEPPHAQAGHTRNTDRSIVLLELAYTFESLDQRDGRVFGQEDAFPPRALLH